MLTTLATPVSRTRPVQVPHHLGVDVDPVDAAGGAHRGREPQGEVARARADVGDALAAASINCVRRWRGGSLA